MIGQERGQEQGVSPIPRSRAEEDHPRDLRGDVDPAFVFDLPDSLHKWLVPHLEEKKGKKEKKKEYLRRLNRTYVQFSYF